MEQMGCRLPVSTGLKSHGLRQACEMNQALYAHMNNKTIKKVKKKGMLNIP
jgi:hypothetical protein